MTRISGQRTEQHLSRRIISSNGITAAEVGGVLICVVAEQVLKRKA